MQTDSGGRLLGIAGCSPKAGTEGIRKFDYAIRELGLRGGEHRALCGHPSHLDQIATDFPSLKIIAHHGGWPWVLEMMSVALRHPNVYVSLAGMRPRHFSKPGGGWLPLLQFGDTLLRDRILWGSNWPMLPIRRSLQEVNDLPLREETLSAWLGGNAARLFGLRPVGAVTLDAAQ